MFELSAPNGKRVQVSGESAGEALDRLGVRKGAVAALLNGQPVDLSQRIDEGGEIAPILPDSAEGLEILKPRIKDLIVHVKKTV